MFAPAAFGVRLHRCTDYPCTGNNRDNVLDERRGNGTSDKILGKGGRDVIDAHWNGRDKDIVLGNRGQDNLDVFDHDNKVPSYDRYGFAFLPT